MISSLVAGSNMSADDTPEHAVTKRRRILLVEDNDDMARGLKLLLEERNYIVELAHNAPLALNIARAFDPDVVLIDIGLPYMNGWELAQRLRAQRSDIAFIAVTAFDGEDDKRQSAEAGFTAHLLKPIDLDQLEQAIESLPRRQP